MAFEFKLPDIGEGIHEGEIVQWLVKPGDFVNEDQPIVEVMTDKVTAEIPAPVSGVIQELRGKPGEVVKVGSVIAVFGENGATAKPKESQAIQQEAGEPVRNGTSQAATAVLERPAGPTGMKVLAAPATRKMARKLGVDLSQVIGSGPRGRITPQDVQNFQTSGKAVATPDRVPAISAGAFRSEGERRVPFGGLRKKIAERLTKSKQTAPHFAYVEEADMSKLVAAREELLPFAEEQGVKLSYLPFVIKAVIAGLRKYPVLNSQLDEATQELVYKNDYNIGIAVATEQGLVVPVVKHADQKNIFTLAREISELAQKARSNKLSLDDVKDGTFTITSIGSIGGLFGIPIINYPEVAILGVNKIEKRPVVRHVDGVDQIVIREMMHLSISGDHRVVDGAEIALFIKDVIRYLENPTLLLMAEGA
jgi:pyruvate dehydrogenase E2 component (dihydrolipoamide acetyltransferase)